MATPVKVKTWQQVSNGIRSLNMSVPAMGTALGCNRRVLRTIKDALLGFALNTAVTRYSCDSITAGAAGDGIDRWTTDANLVWSGTNHSWYVFRFPGLPGPFEMCIALNAAIATGVSATIVFSNNAFTGGTTSARPTATEEFASILAPGTWSLISGNFSSRVSVQMTSDGECCIITVAANGVQSSNFIFGKLQNPVTGFTFPHYNYVRTDTTPVSLTSSDPVRYRHAGVYGSARFAGEASGIAASNNDAAVAAANGISGEWPIAPVSLWSTTAAMTGRHGTLFDIYMGLSAVATGDTYPIATADWAQFGTILIPWDGGTINLA